MSGLYSDLVVLEDVVLLSEAVGYCADLAEAWDREGSWAAATNEGRESFLNHIMVCQ